MAEEWEGDPHDPDFWKRFEGENSQSQLRKKQKFKADADRGKQHDVLDKQSNVFKQLKETDELVSDRHSMRGTVMGFGIGKNSNAGRNFDQYTRRSNTSLFTNTLQPGQENEHIPTEIDQNEYSMMMATNNPMGVSIVPSRKLLHDASLAVMTDHDITDEVGQAFGASIRHQIDFRDKNKGDVVQEDRNIEDM